MKNVSLLAKSGVDRDELESSKVWSFGWQHQLLRYRLFQFRFDDVVFVMEDVDAASKVVYAREPAKGTKEKKKKKEKEKEVDETSSLAESSPARPAPAPLEPAHFKTGDELAPPRHDPCNFRRGFPSPQAPQNSKI